MNEEYGVDFIARCMAGEALEKAGDGYSLVAGDNIEITTDEVEKTKTISADLSEIREVPETSVANANFVLASLYNPLTQESTYGWKTLAYDYIAVPRGEDVGTSLTITHKYEGDDPMGRDSYDWISIPQTLRNAGELVPSQSVSDVGKVLTVTESGGTRQASWVTPQAFTQVQADWTQSNSSATDYIKNKPTLAAVATSGDYNDLINTPPALPEIGPNDGGKLLQAVVTGSGIPSPNLLVQEEKEIPSGYNDGTIEYSFILQAAIPGGSDEKGTAEYNQFVYAYAGYNAQDRALDARTQSYANSQFYAKLPAGSYKLVFEMVNGPEDAIIWYKSVLEEDPYMALVDDSNTVIVSDNTFNQITGRPQWTQKIYTFTVNDETNVGLFYKLYPNNFRAYIVPDDTEFVAFTNSQFIETGHPTFSGTTGWAPYGKTGYDWASVQAQVQSDWAQSDNTAVDYIKNKPSLAAVATSGSYNDLTDKPTIPDGLPTHTVSNLNDVLSVDSNNHVVWRDCREVPSYGPAMNGRELKVVTTGQTTSLEWVVPSEVPAVGSGDDGKVLTASYSGGVGSYSWASAPAPSGVEMTSNKVTSLSNASTDTQYPSAKCVYDLVGNIQTVLASLTTPSSP